MPLKRQFDALLYTAIDVLEFGGCEDWNGSVADDKLVEIRRWLILDDRPLDDLDLSGIERWLLRCPNQHFMR